MQKCPSTSSSSDSSSVSTSAAVNCERQSTSNSSSSTASDEEYQIGKNRDDVAQLKAVTKPTSNRKRLEASAISKVSASSAANYSKPMSSAEFAVKYSGHHHHHGKRRTSSSSIADNLSTIASSTVSSSEAGDSNLCLFNNIVVTASDSASNAQNNASKVSGGTCTQTNGVIGQLQPSTSAIDLQHVAASNNNNLANNNTGEHGILIKFASIMYATLLVVFGCVLHVSELRHKSRNSLDHIYCICVALIGFVWLSFLHADLQRYKRFARRTMLAAARAIDQNDRRQRDHIQHDSDARHHLTSSSSTSSSGVSSTSSLVRGAGPTFADTELVLRQFALSQRRVIIGGSSAINHHNDQNSIHSSNAQRMPAYKLLRGKLGASFYLKCGMAAFCFGHVVHEGLRFGQQLYFFSSDYTRACQDLPALLAHLVTPLYSFYQLFMMFKYSNLVINTHKTLARFGLMHIIGTSVTFWFRTIIEEAFEDFVHKMSLFETTKGSYKNGTDHHNHHVTPALAGQLPDSLFCSQNTLLTAKSMNALPYLYPFTIEYNLLIAATFLGLYLNIGKLSINKNSGDSCKDQGALCGAGSEKKLSASSLSTSSSPSTITSQPIKSTSKRLSISATTSNIEQQQQQHAASATTNDEFKSNFVVSADCHSATIGLFCGFFVLLVALVTIVIFFVTINKPSHAYLGVKINTIQEATLTSLLLIVTLFGFRKMCSLKKNTRKANKATTDDVLMLIPLPFFFIHTLLSFRAELAALTASSSPSSSVHLSTINTLTTLQQLNATTTMFSSTTTSSNRATKPLHNSTTPMTATQRFAAATAAAAMQPTLVDKSRPVFMSQNNTQSRKKSSSSTLKDEDKRYKLFTMFLNVLVMIEVLLQTTFIIDGARRESESRYLRFKKPGRELVTFAIILNITYWLVATFETKSVEQYKTEVAFYGPLPYMFISHTTLPVMLFYRYHSSVCLAEIWTRAYKPPKQLSTGVGHHHHLVVTNE